MEELYTQENQALNARIQSYTTQSQNYEAQINAWKAKGGGSQKEYFQIESHLEDLNEQLFLIDKQRAKIQNMIDAMNAVATSLNMMADNMNIAVEKYNGIGAQQGEEYQEGTYIRNKNSTKIDIYQFDDREMLIRALVHELGHAIGLEHIDNPESIMYRLNEGTNNSLSPDDINAIKNICK
jgi:chromosome segregation ATPase